MKGFVSTDNGQLDRVYHTKKDCQNWPLNPKEVEVTDEMRECGHCKGEKMSYVLEKMGKRDEPR